MQEALGPMEPGLVVVSVSTPSLQPLVRAGFEQQCRRGGDRLGRRLPVDAPVHSIYAGPDRKAREAQALALAQKTNARDSSHTFEAIGTRDGFAWCTDEGLHVLLPMLGQHAKGWMTLTQAAEGITSATLVDALSRIRNAAKKAKTFVMLFLVGRQGQDLRVQDFVDAHILVDECEREPGALAGFSVEYVDLADLHALGIGKSMCAITLQDGRYRWLWSPFISAKLIDRVIWKLHSEGRPLSEIGKIVGVDKSTVHRHLAAMPHASDAALQPGWLGRYADVLDLNLPPEMRSEDPTGEPIQKA